MPGAPIRSSEPGAYRVVDLAGESVILVRGDGLYAHLNFCRHRGSRLLCGEGTVARQHSLPVSRVGVRARRTAGRVAFRCERRDTGRVAPPAPRRCRALGRLRLRASIARARSGERRNARIAARRCAAAGRARYPLAELETARTIRYEVAANWKVILENYNECYHCAGVHPELCRVVPAFKRNGGAGLDWERGIPHRDGAWTFTASGTSDRAAFATLGEDEKVRHKGELIYPNFMLSLAADHVAAFSLWPHGPAATTVVCDFLFHPDEIARRELRSERRRRLLGSRQSSGLEDLRERPGRNAVAGLHARLLRADGGREPRHSPLYRRAGCK